MFPKFVETLRKFLSVLGLLGFRKKEKTAFQSTVSLQVESFVLGTWCKESNL